MRTSGISNLSRSSRIGVALLVLAGALVILPRLLSFAEISISLVAWPWQFDFDEGINLNATLQLAQGHNIYRLNGPEGFISAPYPPLFYIINAPISWVTGAALWPGRLISLLSTLTIAVLAAYIVRRVTGKWGVGLLAGGLWMSLSPVIVWSSLYKQDMPALALALGGMAWAVSEGRRPELGTAQEPAEGSNDRPSSFVLRPSSNSALYLSALFFALAFYTKQSALAPAAATMTWLLVRDWRAGLRFAGVLAAIITIPYLGANLLLKGGLWEHLVENHSLSWTMDRANRTLRRLLAEYWPLLLWGGGCIVSAFFLLVGIGRRTADGGRRMMSIRSRIGSAHALLIVYLLWGSASTFAQMGYEGSNYNHLLDVLLPLCMVVGLSAGWLWKLIVQRPKSKVQNRESKFYKNNTPVVMRGAFPTLALALLGATLAAQLFVYDDPHTWYRGGWPGEALDADMKNLSHLVAGLPGDIYSENAHLLLINGKEVIYDDPSTFVPLAKMGRWDESVFVQSLRDRRFEVVLLQQGSDRWTPAALQAFRDNYTVKFRSIVDTYVARLDPPVPQYTLDCTFSDGEEAVTLRGYALGPGVAQSGVRRGDALHATLYWQPEEKLRHSYATYLHLINAKGEQVASRDNPATGATGTTDTWNPGTVVTDTTALPIPANLQPGRYKMLIGMYQQVQSEIVPLTPECKDGQPYGSAVLIGEVEVR